MNNANELLRTMFDVYTPSNSGNFTNDEYRLFLEGVKSFMDIVPLNKTLQHQGERSQIGLRFDVDCDILASCHCARVEYELGVSSTYFFLPTAWYYGEWKNGECKRNSGIFQIMRYLQDELGREIGVHDDCISMLVNHGLEPEEFLERELKIWRAEGVRVEGICSHNSKETYGIDASEIWEGLSCDGKSYQLLNNGISHQTGYLRLEDFDLAYEGNLLSSVQTGKCCFFQRQVDYALGINRNGAYAIIDLAQDCVQHENGSLQEILEEIKCRGERKRWLFLGHPQYFGKNSEEFQF